MDVSYRKEDTFVLSVRQMELNTPPNPCYDVKTKTSCPDRCNGCAVTCPKWAAYEKARTEVYDKRKDEFNRDAVRFARHHKIEEKYLKNKQRMRRIKRR